MRQKVNFNSLPPNVKKTLKRLFLAVFLEVILMIVGAVLIESGSDFGNFLLIFAVIGLVITIISISILTRKHKRK